MSVLTVSKTFRTPHYTCHHATSHSFLISELLIVKTMHTAHIATPCAMRGSVNPYGRSRNVTIALSIVIVRSTYLSSLKRQLWVLIKIKIDELRLLIALILPCCYQTLQIAYQIAALLSTTVTEGIQIWRQLKPLGRTLRSSRIFKIHCKAKCASWGGESLWHY